MKDTFSIIVLIVAFFLIGFFLGKEYVTPEIITHTKIDTVKVGYDSAYVSILKFMGDKTKKELRAERERNKKLAWRLRNVKPTVKIDTFTIHDTLFTVYSSAFRIGTDTLNCTGNAYFDMKKFYFTGTRFTYPRRTIFKTKLITKTNWTITAIASAVALGLGVLIAK